MKGFFEKKQTAAEKEKNKKISFYDRLMKRNKGDFLQDLNTLIKEIKSFSEDNLLNKLSEQEAAKRLAIGTKVGKYHSKTMQIRGFQWKISKKSSKISLNCSQNSNYHQRAPKKTPL